MNPMRVLIVRNTPDSRVLQQLGMQNREFYKEGDIESVRDALAAHGHDVEILEGDVSLFTRLEIEKQRHLRADELMVFNLAYGIQGESRYTHIPSILELLGIPYVGSGPRAHTIALDKYLTKVLLEHAGLPTPAYQLVDSAACELSKELSFPVIVKPRMESTSFGLTLATNEAELNEAVSVIGSEFKQAALVEEFISGAEVNCGLLGNQHPKAFPVLEIDFGDVAESERIFGFETKKNRTARHVCPARIPGALAQTIQRLSREAFGILGCNDVARIDFRIDADGNPYILEINSMAAIHRDGSYFDAARTAGMSYEELIIAIFNAAFIRYFS